MRIRTVKPEFFRHEELFDAEMETGLPLRIAFVGLWCASDREGRFKWRPRTLKSEIMPFDDVDFSRVLHALATRGFIANYTSGTGEFGCIPSFSKHQVINNRERASEIPKPSDFKGSDACLTREPRVDHAGKGEGKGKEGKGKERNTPPKSPKGESLSASDLIKEIPDDWTPVQKQAAKDWAEDKQSRSTKRQRFQSINAWKANLKRMKLYRSDVLYDAIEQAIASGWQGWEQESVKAKLQATKAPAHVKIFTPDDL
jgi:hypothetical protein